MKKLLVYLPDELHEDLKELSHRKKTPMAELVRRAIEETYVDELDALLGERGLTESPDSISLEAFMAKYGTVVQH